MRNLDRACRLALPALLLVAAACNRSNHRTPSTPLTVTSTRPVAFVAYRETAFTVFGTGFERSADAAGDASITTGVVAPHGFAAGQQVTVTFRAQDSAPFAAGTSVEASVPGTVISDTEIVGVAPTTDQPGGWRCAVEVSDAFGSAATPAPASLFLGLTVLDIDRETIPGDQATPFQVFGLSFLPAGGNATVRFTSATPGAFPGGASTIDVPGTIVDPQHIDGTSPVLALTSPVQAFVGVVLDQEPGTPEAISNVALVEFLPAPPAPVVVASIAPSSLPIATPTPFTITGSGFLGATNPNVEVTFRASTGTPLARGSAVAVTVLGTAVNDTTVTGISPTGTAVTDVRAFVSVARADGVEGTSATDIALFTAPTASVDVFTPDTVPADTTTPFAITGTNLPAAPPTAIVRFLATEGTPFTNGTTDTIDVTATTTSSTLITGSTPLATTATDFLAEVTVILQGGVELPMGARCLFTAPAPPAATCIVTTLADSGAGSLRDAIANAPPGCIITFASGLSGTIGLTSTLDVVVPVTILGPEANEIAVGAAGLFPDFPIFTIEPTAAGTEVLQLTVSGSRHDDDGGGFRVRGDLTLQQCVVADNRIAGRGAALCITDHAHVALVACTLRDNSATNRGGTFVGDGSTLEAVGCTFHDNSSDAGGGGVALDDATFDCSNCTFTTNEANGSSGGGAIDVGPGAIANLVHCTLADNTCNARGGGVVVQSQATLNATNCIFSRNSAGQEFPEIWSRGTNNTTWSLVRVGDGSNLTNGVDGNLVGTTHSPIDAKLQKLAANGGPTMTMALKTNSPALDAANPATSLPKDQRGVARPQGPAPDMGAYEENVSL